MNLFLIMLLWSNLSEIVVLNKSFVTTKDDVVAGLERDNAELQNTIVGLREELEHVKGGGSDDVARLKHEKIKLRNNIMGAKRRA